MKILQTYFFSNSIKNSILINQPPMFMCSEASALPSVLGPPKSPAPDSFSSDYNYAGSDTGTQPADSAAHGS